MNSSVPPDHGVGFVSLEEIYNVMTEWMRELDENVCPVDGTFHRPSLVHHCENLKHDLIKRAKTRLEELSRLNPDLAQRIANEKAARESNDALSQQALRRDADTSRNDTEAWKKRTQLGRMYAAASMVEGFDPLAGARKPR